ncbi:MAG: hypothetical protein JNJ45_11855 [Chthonomonas sp.]|nr:hypothetical protein [Chthonomonas sp.]
MGKRLRIERGTVFSVDLERQGFAGGLVTHRGKQLLRVVASPVHYPCRPNAQAVVSDIDRLGIGFSAIIVDKGFQIGLFEVLGCELVPLRCQSLPLFYSAQDIVQYSEESLDTCWIVENPPNGAPIFEKLLLPPWGFANCLRYILVDKTHYWEPAMGILPLDQSLCASPGGADQD